MTYTEKELKEIKQLEFNKDVDLPNVETITLGELKPTKTYIVKVEVEDVNKVDVICRNLKEAFERVGIKKILIIPTYYGQPAIKLYELEPSNSDLEPTIE